MKKKIIFSMSLFCSLNSISQIIYSSSSGIVTSDPTSNSYSFDFNNDGIEDAVIHYNDMDQAYQFDAITTNPNQTEFISTIETDAMYGTTLKSVTKLNFNAPIGPTQTYYPPMQITAGMVVIDYFWGGSAFHFPLEESYVGVKFFISGNAHFAWIKMRRFAPTDVDSRGIEILGYAYESNANTQILAGDIGNNSASIIENKNIIEVFPNPCSNRITINCESEKIFLMDINGKLKDILEKTIDNTYNISDIEPGVYFIKLESGEYIHFLKE